MVTVRPLLLTTCWLLASLGAASPALAAPVRVNVDGTGMQDLAQGTPNETLMALFEVAGPRPLPNETDEPIDLPVMTTVDPEQGSVVLDPEPKTTSSTLQDEWLLTTRSLPGQPTAEEAALAEARGMGGFLPPAPAALIAETDPVDSVKLASPAAAPAAIDAVVAHVDADALKQQRHTIQWVVAPLVLVVMLVALATSGRHSHRRRVRHKVKRG